MDWNKCTESLPGTKNTDCAAGFVCDRSRSYNGTHYNTAFGCTPTTNLYMFGPVNSCSKGKNSDDKMYKSVRCICNSDGCNPATAPTAALALLVSAALAAFLRA